MKFIENSKTTNLDRYHADSGSMSRIEQLKNIKSEWLIDVIDASKRYLGKKPE